MAFCDLRVYSQPQQWAGVSLHLLFLRPKVPEAWSGQRRSALQPTCSRRNRSIPRAIPPRVAKPDLFIESRGCRPVREAPDDNVCNQFVDPTMTQRTQPDSRSATTLPATVCTARRNGATKQHSSCQKPRDREARQSFGMIETRPVYDKKIIDRRPSIRRDTGRPAERHPY